MRIEGWKFRRGDKYDTLEVETWGWGGIVMSDRQSTLKYPQYIKLGI